MNKHYEFESETIALFKKVLETTSIPSTTEILLIGNDDLKEIYVVRKLSDLYEYVTNGTNIVLILNGAVFDGLTEKQKELVFEEALSTIFVNPDSGKISIEKLDIYTSSGMLNKYGNDEIILLKESIKSLTEAKKIKEKEEKPQKK